MKLTAVMMPYFRNWIDYKTELAISYEHNIAQDIRILCHINSRYVQVYAI